MLKKCMTAILSFDVCFLGFSWQIFMFTLYYDFEYHYLSISLRIFLCQSFLHSGVSFRIFAVDCLLDDRDSFQGGSSFSFEGYWILKSRLLVRLLNLPSRLAWLVCWKAYNFLTNLMHQPLFIIRILTSFYFSQIQIDWILVIGFQQGKINQNRHILLNVSQGDVIVECNWSTYFISL